MFFLQFLKFTKPSTSTLYYVQPKKGQFTILNNEYIFILYHLFNKILGFLKGTRTPNKALRKNIRCRDPEQGTASPRNAPNPTKCAASSRKAPGARDPW